jgi:hypothetical protein
MEGPVEYRFARPEVDKTLQVYFFLYFSNHPRR